MFTDDSKTLCLMASGECFWKFRRGRDEFLSKIVTADETWVFHDESGWKRQSLELKHVTSPVRREFQARKTEGKLMITVF